VREEGNDHCCAGRVDHDFSQRFVFFEQHDEGNRGRSGRIVVLVVVDDSEHAAG
jgi:hypothetical protein